MVDFDKGPPDDLAAHFAQLPPIKEEFRKYFWYDWGPVFYRGRLDGHVKFLGIASDPGPTERLVCRTLVGDAGQRVQGFLARIGLTRSYSLVNAYPVAVHPSMGEEANPVLSDKDQRDWRNEFYNKVIGPELQAIVAFGGNASDALGLWDDKPDVPTFEVPHPSNPNEELLLNKWRDVIPKLRAAVTPDADGDVSAPNYGTVFEEKDYARIPPADLPFGIPPWMGDDSWGRRATPRHNNAVRRPREDSDHTLLWQCPKPEDLVP
jgi:hypothetical protein